MYSHIYIYMGTFCIPYLGSFWSVNVQEGSMLVQLQLVEQVALWGLEG